MSSYFLPVRHAVTLMLLLSHIASRVPPAEGQVHVYHMIADVPHVFG